MDKVTGPDVRAWWFNPRTGEATLIGEFGNRGTREFLAPNPGDDLDWVALTGKTKNEPPERDIVLRRPDPLGTVGTGGGGGYGPAVVRSRNYAGGGADL